MKFRINQDHFVFRNRMLQLQFRMFLLRNPLHGYFRIQTTAIRLFQFEDTIMNVLVFAVRNHKAIPNHLGRKKKNR